jgi:hypothetical protein
MLFVFAQKNCKLLDALEGENQELFLKEELLPRAQGLGNGEETQLTCRSIYLDLANPLEGNFKNLFYSLHPNLHNTTNISAHELLGVSTSRSPQVSLWSNQLI